MLLDDLINAIYRMEGSSNPNSINQKMISQYGLYDPGHLTYANQPGAVPVTIGNHTWAGFSSPEDANTAMASQITLDASRGHTLETFIGKYAPSSENNTSGYLSTVANWLGVDPNISLADIVNGTVGGDTPSSQNTPSDVVSSGSNNIGLEVVLVVGAVGLAYLLLR